MPRHLLSIEDLDRDGIERICARAASFGGLSAGRALRYLTVKDLLTA